jgi:hypothetical protein
MSGGNHIHCNIIKIGWNKMELLKTHLKTIGDSVCPLVISLEHAPDDGDG